jgi:acetolactate decarboxylase
MNKNAINPISSKSLNQCLLSLLLMIVMGCNSKSEMSREYKSSVQEVTADKNTFYQYNIWWGFVNKVFDGDLTVKELKARGSIGLGSYTQLDGELVMLDGIPYRIREDGSVSIPADSDSIVYVDAAFFEPESTFNIEERVNFDSLRRRINSQLPTQNNFYAFVIKGDFSYMKCGGLSRQEKPYTEGLDVLIPARPVFERENFRGTMIGFFCPEFIGNINVTGYHMHFISEDKQFGGHVMEFSASNLSIEVDPLLEYHFTLPESDDFSNVSMEKKFQYQNQ